MKPGLVPQHLSLGPGAEFDRIRELVRILGARARGLGDDCALLTDIGGTLALSTDVSVERVHFRLDWVTLAEAGWRSAAAAQILAVTLGLAAISGGVPAATFRPAHSAISCAFSGGRCLGKGTRAPAARPPATVTATRTRAFTDSGCPPICVG